MATHPLAAPADVVTTSGPSLAERLPVQARAADLIAAGCLPVPSYGLALPIAGEDPRAHRYQPEDFRLGMDVTILLGRQPSGAYKYVLDLDSHKAGQDADAARAAFEGALRHVANKIAWKRSHSGTGWHGQFESNRKLATGPLFDSDGHHIGELLGKDTDRIRDPGDTPFPFLTYSDVEQLLQLYSVRGAAEGAETWTRYAKAGASYTHGWERERPNVPKLSVFLETYGGERGARLAQLRTLGRGERSEMIAGLAQTVLLHVHKLGRADFFTYARRARALLEQSDAFGKAAERTYNYEKDLCALIAKIVSGAARADGYAWLVPFWAKAQGVTPAAIEADETPEPPRRPGRPAGSGNREKRRAKLRKILAATPPDDWGRIHYCINDLAEQLKASRRTVQDDLAALRDNHEISTAQIAGNGGACAVLLSGFGRAINCAKPDKTPPKSTDSRGAINEAVLRTPTLKTADKTDNAIRMRDHHNTCAPPDEPLVATAPGAPAGAHPCGDLLSGSQVPPGPAPSSPGGEPPELPRRPLRELVAEGLAVYAEAPARGKRSRAALVREHVATNGGAHYPAEAVAEHYRMEIECQRIAGIRTLNGLKAYLRTVEHRVERAAAEESHSAAWWQFVARLVADEIRSRPPEAPKERRSPRKQCEALPNLRTLGEQRQLEILRDAARELQDWRHERPRAGTGHGAGVFTPTAALAPPAPEYDASGLIARLRARQQAPAAAAE